MKWLIAVLVLVAWVCSLAPAAAATIGQVDRFDAGVAGWQVGGSGTANGPNVVSGGGIDGAYLNYTTDNANTGGRFLIMNSAQWSGDYLNAGISGVSAVARNEGDVELNMRLLLQGPGGGFFSSVAETLPINGQWQVIHFPISSSALTGGNDLGKTLSSVSQIRIFHNPSPSFPGPVTNASMSIDNIRAVPEASTLPMLLGTLGWVAFVRRRITV